MADEYFTPAIIKKLRAYMIVPGTKIPISKVMEALGNPQTSYDEFVNKNLALKKINQDDIFNYTVKALKIIEDFLRIQKEKYIEKQMEKIGLPPENEKKQTSKNKTDEPSKPPKSVIKFEIEGDINKADEVKIFIDGCSKGNPGPSAISTVFTDFIGQKLYFHSEKIPDGTNNTAEYQALIFALKKAREFKKDKIFVFSDSQLLVNQMNGVFKIKNIDILKLVSEAQGLRQKFKKAQIVYIPREENKEADKLANMVFKKDYKKEEKPA